MQSRRLVPADQLKFLLQERSNNGYRPWLYLCNTPLSTRALSTPKFKSERLDTMAVSRREFLRCVGQAGGYSAAFLVMQGMGLMEAKAATQLEPAEPGIGKG